MKLTHCYLFLQNGFVKQAKGNKNICSSEQPLSNNLIHNCRSLAELIENMTKKRMTSKAVKRVSAASKTAAAVKLDRKSVSVESEYNTSHDVIIYKTQLQGMLTYGLSSHLLEIPIAG